MILDGFLFLNVNFFNAELVLGLGFSLEFVIETPNCIVSFEVGSGRAYMVITG